MKARPCRIKAFRAVFENPPPEGYLILQTVSSWRKSRASANEAAQAFHIAADNGKQSDGIAIGVRIEETVAELCTIHWRLNGVGMKGTDLALLPVLQGQDGDASRHQDETRRCTDAGNVLLEKFGDRRFTIFRVTTKQVTGRWLNKNRKHIR